MIDAFNTMFDFDCAGCCRHQGGGGEKTGEDATDGTHPGQGRRPRGAKVKVVAGPPSDRQGQQLEGRHHLQHQHTEGELQVAARKQDR